MAFVYKPSDRPFLRVTANTGAAVARLKSARLVTPSLVEASPRIWTVAVLSARTETVTVETMAEEMTDRTAEMVEVMAETTEAHDVDGLTPDQIKVIIQEESVKIENGSYTAASPAAISPAAPSPAVTLPAVASLAAASASMDDPNAARLKLGNLVKEIIAVQATVTKLKGAGEQATRGLEEARKSMVHAELMVQKSLEVFKDIGRPRTCQHNRRRAGHRSAGLDLADLEGMIDRGARLTAVLRVGLNAVTGSTLVLPVHDWDSLVDDEETVGNSSCPPCHMNGRQRQWPPYKLRTADRCER
ncbi:hypothetical protein D6C84_09832 [Aureobasidium pullulans]|uniref:Uncharacterized protein n=1 Tax=Aureobasidium pullulans TaxID=5580 RepID=A0A4V4KYD2_AURPU|nr:hypothetical protein D6C84_09832 [Aureobasidium pullulans]